MNEISKYDIKIIINYSISIILIILSLMYPDIYLSNQIKCIGFFSLSGSITNWLAIKMLFKKIPFLYGSGVILTQFDDLKLGIKKLIFKEFFNKKQLKIFIEKFKDDNQNFLNKIKDKINYNKIYDVLLNCILTSKFSLIIDMMGGKKILEKYKNPIILKVKIILNQYIDEISDQYYGNELINITEKNINSLLNNRINELTPYMIKKIIEDIIEKHLGWLIIWGGFFGGFIGLLFSYL